MGSNADISKIHLLLVEDNPGDARFVRELLNDAEPNTFTIHEAHSLEAAMGELKKRAIHVVVLDLSLPDSRGLRTFSVFKNEAPELPVIILTGLQDEEVAKTAITLGAHDYLPKRQLDGALLAKIIRYAATRTNPNTP